MFGFVQIELFRKVYDEKVLIAGHSWGDNVVRGFLHWMDDIDSKWVDQHVAVVFNCAGPVLGALTARTYACASVSCLVLRTLCPAAPLDCSSKHAQA